MGRAKEDESWDIILKPLSESIRQNRVMQTIADGGRSGEVRYLGEFPATDAAIRKLVAKLAAEYSGLSVTTRGRHSRTSRGCAPR